MSAPVAQTRPLHTFKSAHTRTLAMNRMSPLELFGQLPVELRLIILTAFPNIFVGGENYALLKDGSVKKNKRNIDIWFTHTFESYGVKEIHVCAKDGLPLSRREMRTTPPAERAVKKVWDMMKGGREIDVYAQLKPNEAITHPDWEEHSKIKFPFYVRQKAECSEKSPFDKAPALERQHQAQMWPAHAKGAAITSKVFSQAGEIRHKWLNTPIRVKDILSGAKTLTYGDFLIAAKLSHKDEPCGSGFCQQPFEWFYKDGTPLTTLF